MFRIFRLSIVRVAAAAACLLAVTHTFAQSQIDWFTVDGGGIMNATGGTFALSGTIGQPDAGSFAAPMAGGTFTLVGGFWPVAGSVCTCPGDMNGDSLKNGADVQQFAQCVISGGTCSCADVDGVPGLSNGDVAVFVTQMLAGSACP